MINQLDEWAGRFGDDYTKRNRVADIRKRAAFWAQVIGGLAPASILEVGCGDGKNLKAISRISDATLYGVDPNEKAIRASSSLGEIEEGAAQQLPFAYGQMDMVMTCGVLIHVHPDDLQKAMEEIYRVSYNYIVCAEYFSAQPETKEYRGKADMLFTRDFGKAWLGLYPELRVVNYGFAWKHVTSMDNLTWFVFQKRLA